MKIWIAVSCLCVFSAFGDAVGATGENSADIRWLQPPDTASDFLPGLVSTGANEHGCTFSPDGRDFYFCRLNPVSSRGNGPAFRKEILVIHWRDSSWSAPVVVPFSGIYDDELPRMSPVKQQLFFTSNRPMPGRVDSTWARSKFAVWVVTNTDTGWSTPQPLGPSAHGLLTVSPAASGNLYSGTEHRLEVLSPDGDGWAPPINLGAPLDRDAGYPYVAPDESFIIFVGTGPGYGKSDLWITFHQPDNTWTAPSNMGGEINTPDIDAAAQLSPDGRCLFFSSGGNIRWINSRVIEQLKAKIMK